jgi:hypothetical protein
MGAPSSAPPLRGSESPAFIVRFDRGRIRKLAVLDFGHLELYSGSRTRALSATSGTRVSGTWTSGKMASQVHADTHAPTNFSRFRMLDTVTASSAHNHSQHRAEDHHRRRRKDHAERRGKGANPLSGHLRLRTNFHDLTLSGSGHAAPHGSEHHLHRRQLDRPLHVPRQTCHPCPRTEPFTSLTPPRTSGSRSAWPPIHASGHQHRTVAQEIDRESRGP